MESKYYTPEIEEFYVGFEYETTYLKSVWTKEVLYKMDCGWFFESYINDAVETEFRVKYLDQEDIESLGWKFDEDETSCLAFVKNIWDLWYYERKQLLTIESEETGIVFKGYIKNKSELKKLLKQLGINE